LVQGRAELADELPGLIAAVEPAAVAAAAKRLRPDARAVLTVMPGGAA
jgi:zinc protease